MREEFFKNERFRSEISSPPAEFEIPSDYGQDEEVTPTNPTEPTRREPTETTGPINNDQPMQEEPTAQMHPQEAEPQITEIPEETPRPRRISRELQNLKSDLNGPSWGCTENHGSRLRVRTAGVQEQYEDSWDNVIQLQEEENTGDQEGTLE